MNELMKSCAIIPLVLALLLPGAVGGAEVPAIDLYKSKCAICHGADGGGDTPMGKRLNIRDLRSEEVQAQSAEQFEQLIANGKGKMPAQKQLSKQELRLLADYVHGLAKKN